MNLIVLLRVLHCVLFLLDVPGFSGDQQLLGRWKGDQVLVWMRVLIFMFSHIGMSQTLNYILRIEEL